MVDFLSTTRKLNPVNDALTDSIESHWANRPRKEVEQFIAERATLPMVLAMMNDKSVVKVATKVTLTVNVTGGQKPAVLLPDHGENDKRIKSVHFELEMLRVVLAADASQRALPEFIYRQLAGRTISRTVRSHWAQTKKYYNQGVGKTFTDILPLIEAEYKRLTED